MPVLQHWRHRLALSSCCPACRGIGPQRS